MDTITACPRGHRYRATLSELGQLTACPRCGRFALVALGYGDCQTPQLGTRSLQFRTELITDPQEAAELLCLPGSYNGYDGRRVWHELQPIFPKLMGIEIGREASPVIYASPAYWTHQMTEWTGAGSGTRIPTEGIDLIKRLFVEAMRRAHADEIGDTGSAMRAWWD